MSSACNRIQNFTTSPESLNFWIDRRQREKPIGYVGTCTDTSDAPIYDHEMIA